MARARGPEHRRRLPQRPLWALPRRDPGACVHVCKRRLSIFPLLDERVSVTSIATAASHAPCPSIIINIASHSPLTNAYPYIIHAHTYIHSKSSSTPSRAWRRCRSWCPATTSSTITSTHGGFSNQADRQAFSWGCSNWGIDCWAKGDCDFMAWSKTTSTHGAWLLAGPRGLRFSMIWAARFCGVWVG